MFLFPILVSQDTVLPQVIVHESKGNTETAPSPGADTKRDFAQTSEQIWRSHKAYAPTLVDVPVPNTTRIGKAWI